MADDIYENGPISVTKFIGGTASTAGLRDPGTCYQINESDRYVQLTFQEAIDVARAILLEAGLREVPGTSR